MGDGKHRVDEPSPDVNILENPRECFLDALRRELACTAGVGAGVVRRGPGGTVLFVSNDRPELQRADIGCDYYGGVWWFTWSASSRRIASVKSVDAAAKAILEVLKQSPAEAPSP
jgi:hypothetical protein